jgi:prophage antirepressor-like protein
LGCAAHSNSDSQNQVKLGETIDNIGYHDGKAVYISEPGLYSLIMHSKAPFAEKFQDLVYETILPSIRKFGHYQLMEEKDKAISQAITDKEKALQDKAQAIADKEFADKKAIHFKIDKRLEKRTTSFTSPRLKRTLSTIALKSEE